jgi:hypothetical protein
MPGRSHFNLFNKDTCDLFMLCLVFMCQLYRALFDHCCSLLLLLIIYFVSCSTFPNISCSIFVLILFFFFSFIRYSFFKRKDSILNLDFIPGILILLYHCTRTTIIIYASQETSHISLHRLCPSIGASGLLRS